MTRVSDTADFALAVADGGALPFLALSLLRGPKVAALLEETKEKLAGRPWGIGILGFVPRELREEQLAEVRKHPPPYAIIAGGRPDQAKALESEGIRTYLHVPSPALLQMFIETGVRRVIFEGRECGGHVGPRTSFVLWESMVRVILEDLTTGNSTGKEFEVLFAGGIHDARSASMVAAMAAPLSERGVSVGVLLGTSYLFTEEAVSARAILRGFQEEAIRCEKTILLETGVGHATRCADTPFGRRFAQAKRQLIDSGRSKDEIREALEKFNLGRLRIASKGVQRTEPKNDAAAAPELAKVDEDTQRLDGMYMIGQVAALRDQVCTIADLHEDVSRTGTGRLKTFAAPEHVRSPGRGPSDVAIVGMSCMFPKAGDLEQFWQNIVNKVDAVGEIPADRWDWRLYFSEERNARDKIYSKWGGFLDDVPFDPIKYGMPPNSLPSVEPLHLLVLEAVGQALDDAGYGERPFDRERASVILGAGGGVADLGLGYGFRALLPYFVTNSGGSSEDADRMIDQLDRLLPDWTEDSFAGLLMNVAAGRVANRFDLSGTNYTVDAACASSLAAVRLGVAELESGSSDMVIVGGADTMQSPFAYLCFSKTQALSPTGQCRTFDEAADGIVISEGVAIAILKRLEDAVRDGDRVYAVIKGVGSSSDGRDKGLTAPRPAGQMRALDRAYSKAGFDPSTVGLIEAHGTGTVAGDQSEVESLTRTFTEAGAAGEQCALGSVKSMIGHTKCAAGVAGILKAALALYHRVLPPTNGVTNPNPKAKFSQSPFYVNVEPRPWIGRPDGEPRRAGVSAFGFGGTNFHAALEEYVPDEALTADTPVARPWPAELFVWRAESGGEIIEAGDLIITAIDEGAEPMLRDLAAAVCREHGRSKGKCCLSIVASSVEDLRAKLASTRAALMSGENAINDPKGVFFSADCASSGKIAFLFPGQGSQSVNMLRDLAIGYAGVRQVLEHADRSLGDALGKPLSGYVYPRPSFTAEAKADDERALTRTDVAQPAMGAADLAVYGILSELGIAADMAGGHSYGEYVALCVAGVFDSSSLLRISEARGRHIAAAGKKNPGTMAAVGADEAAVSGIVGALDGVSIANLNSPQQTVITGTESGVDNALAQLKKQGIAGRRINVSCAFHSALVAGACEPFAEVLGDVEFGAPRIPVYSNTTAKPHPTDSDAIRRQLVDHIVQPVRFASELVAMHDAGARVFVEVGPGRTLTSFAERTLADRDFVAVNLDKSGGNGLTNLINGLARLAAAGVDMRLDRLFEGRVQGGAERLDLSRLVEQTKPAPLSPVTVMVNGTRAVPLKELSGRGTVTGEVKAPKDARWRLQSEVTQPESEPAVRIPQPLVPGAHSGGPTAQPPPTVPTTPQPPATEQAGASDSVMSAYHSLMSKFLDTQKNVMLDYLRRTGTGVPGEQTATVQPSVPSPPPEPISLAGASGDRTRADTQAVTGEARTSQPPEPLERGPIEAPSQVVGADTETPVDAEAPDVPVSDSGLKRESLVAQLLTIVSDRTGYPPDMLDLDSDLEADLGIDSIKRIEILSALQAESMFPDESAGGDIEELARQKTLRAIVDWIVERTETPAVQPATAMDGAQPVVQTEGAGAASTDRQDEPEIDDAVQPAPRMLLDVVECSLVESQPPKPLQGAVVITDDGRGVASSLAKQLRDAGHKVVTVAGAGRGSGNGRHPGVDFSDRSAVDGFIERTRSEHGAIAALVHLLPLSRSDTTRSDDPATWFAAVTADLHGLLNLIQSLEDDLRDSAGSVVVACAIDGAFAMGSVDRSADAWPGDGGVCGFTKSLAREWTDVSCTVVDLDPAMPAGQMANALRSELLTPDENAEVGYCGGKRVVIQPTQTPLDTNSNSIDLDNDSTVLVAGGARGITAQVAIELAERFKPKLLLVGRSALPPAEESSETAGVTDAKQLKAILRKQIERSGEKATPASVRSAHTRLLSERETRVNLSAMRAAGATVEYHSVDVGDAGAFGDLLDRLHASHGRIDGVIHGAGITEDKLIRDKTFDSLERVLRPKVTGALVLASKLRPESLKFLFFFSSVSARYGNRGQSDYAAANEVLNKLAHWMNVRCPGRVASLNWGPWESAGSMVSAELAKMFARAGIKLITPDAGRKAFVDELLFGDKSDVEVVYGGRLTTPSAGREVKPAKVADHARHHEMPLLNDHSKVIPQTGGSIEVVRTLDPAFDLYLLDHQLDGRPVMPMAMGLELLAEVASEAVPDMRLDAVRELRVLRGVTLDHGPKTLRVVATPNRHGDGSVTVDLRAETAAPPADRTRVCYSASAEFGLNSAASSVEPLVLTDPRPLSMSVAEAYERWLFHGPLFAGIVDVEAIGTNGIIATLAPSSPRRCLATANGSQWLIDPVVVDSGLQMLILWARSYVDMTPLPSRLGCYHRLGGGGEGHLRCEVCIRSGPQNAVIHADMMFYDSAGKLTGWLEDMEVTCSKALNRLSETRPSSTEVKP